MFKQKNGSAFNSNGYYENTQFQRIYYEIEEINRKIRNVNNRLRRIEGFLGLRTDDKYEKDSYLDD